MIIENIIPSTINIESIINKINDNLSSFMHFPRTANISDIIIHGITVRNCRNGIKDIPWIPNVIQLIIEYVE